MQKERRIPFSKLTFGNWQNLIFLTVLVFYLVSLSYAIGEGPIQAGFAGDYLAFWSAGKIADEKGYSQIYDLENLKSVQLHELKELDLTMEIEASSYSALPVALFPVFVFPFQLLSKINFEPSYWVWTIINLIVLIGYLIYYKGKIAHSSPEKATDKKLLLLMLLAFPVWKSFTEGQVEILLVVCVGEFVHQAINKKPFLSGLWLGGLMLKPQLLILIIPALLLMRYWKALSGFIISSFILLTTSFFLSGFAGLKAMADLWTKFSAGMTTNTPEAMINWRMIGLNINSLFGTSFGWVLAGLGMVLTTVLIYLLLKRKPTFGSSAWIITMAAVFSATLAVTWHSHYHMAVVLIPFLIYASQFSLLPNKLIFAWATTTGVLFFILLAITTIILLITKKSIIVIGYLVAISGFCLNMLIALSSYRCVKARQIIPETLPVENSTT